MAKVGGKLGHEVSEATRAKIAASLRGRKRPDISARTVGRRHSEDHRRAISEGLRRFDPICSVDGCERAHAQHGFCDSHSYRFKQYGDPLGRPLGRELERNGGWKGDDATWGAIHRRAASRLPRFCAVCGATNVRLEVAFRHFDYKGELRAHVLADGREIPYTTDWYDYVRLCVSCHRKLDSPRLSTRQPIIDVLTRS